MTARPEILIHGREVRANTQAAPRTNLAKVFNCDATHQVHGRAITGEASEYLKKTLMRDMFVMACRAVKSRETMSLSVKNTALWALKVPLEEMSRLATFCQCWGRRTDVSSGTRITTSAMSQDGGYVRSTH
jgi:hypothetical protein